MSYHPIIETPQQRADRLLAKDQASRASERRQQRRECRA